MNKSEIIAQAAEYLDVFTSKMEKMPDTANVKRLVAELYAIAASAGDAPAVQGEPVGEAGSLHGTKGFTTDVFESKKVPEGTKLYAAPHPTEQQPIRSDLARNAANHLTNWLEMDICECEGGHYCGYNEVKRTRDALLEAAEQQPAPDVAQLVEALTTARETIAYALRTNAPDYFTTDADIARHVVIQRIDTALAAHRKQGGDQ